MRLLACAALAVLACSGAQKPTQPEPKLNRWGKPHKEGVAVPAWVASVPEAASGRLIAVGYSQPSFWPQDAIDAAADDARGKLALALTSHVEVLGMDTATERSSGGATVDKEATDVVMQNSRIEATWVDENGDRGEPGGVWALASIDVDSVRGARRAPQVQPGVAGAPRPGPAWLDRLPGTKGKLFATGYSGPTFEKDAAIRYAGDNAIEHLADSLRSHVQAYTLLVESASGLSLDQFAHSDDPEQSFLDLVRKNAKVEDTWVDAEGARPGDPPGAVWALASIDVQSTKGGVKPVENPDLAPALDAKGNDATAK